MKNFPTQKILIVFLLLSVAMVVSLELIFSDSKELFRGGAKLSDLTTNLCLAYISGYFFYCVTVSLPKRIEREHVKEHIAHLIDRALFHILFIMQDATNSKISQKSLKLDSITIEEFKAACTNVYMDNNASPLRASEHGRPMRIGEAVSRNIQEMQFTINEIFKYSQYIEAELISLISSASRNSLNESWIFSNNMVPLQVGEVVLVAKRTDASGYAKCLSEYHNLYKEIESILLKKYKDTVTVKRHIENLNNLKKS